MIYNHPAIFSSLLVPLSTNRQSEYQKGNFKSLIRVFSPSQLYYFSNYHNTFLLKKQSIEKLKPVIKDAHLSIYNIV